MIDIFYRRPDSSSSSIRSISSWERLQPGIPDSLSFDKIINGKTCSPCSLYDFISYLRHVEHNFEPLKFYMWLRDYTRRFGSLPEAERALSPEWRPPPPAIRRLHHSKSVSKSVATTATTSVSATELDDGQEDVEADGVDAEDIKMVFSESVDVEYPSASRQPFRAEVNEIISLYLLPSSPFQLNISSHDLTTCLRSLATTTHPSAFAIIHKSVSVSLRHQSHPSFISFALRNANPARIVMIRIFGVLNLLAALITGILLILSSHKRVKRIGCFVPVFVGTIALFNSFRGLCTILLLLGFKRNRNPWEKFREVDGGGGKGVEMMDKRVRDEEEGVQVGEAGIMLEEIDPGRVEREREFIASYLKLPVRTRMYDFTPTQNREIRMLQITLFLQSAIVGALAAGAYVGILMAIPPRNIL